jgi:hypothetical protein
MTDLAVVESRRGSGVKMRRQRRWSKGATSGGAARRACASAAGEPCRVWMEWTGGVGAYIPTGVDLGFV